MAIERTAPEPLAGPPRAKLLPYRDCPARVVTLNWSTKTTPRRFPLGKPFIMRVLRPDAQALPPETAPDFERPSGPVGRPLVQPAVVSVAISNPERPEAQRRWLVLSCPIGGIWTRGDLGFMRLFEDIRLGEGNTQFTHFEQEGTRAYLHKKGTWKSVGFYVPRPTCDTLRQPCMIGDPLDDGTGTRNWESLVRTTRAVGLRIFPHSSLHVWYPLPH